MEGIKIIKNIANDDRTFLAEYNGQICVLKKYHDAIENIKEVAILNRVSLTGYAPKILLKGKDFIVQEYLEGQSLNTLFIQATRQDDVKMLENLANWLSIYLQIFYSVVDGCIVKHIDFNNFIIFNDRCYGVDYDSVEEGLNNIDIANIVAYACVNCVGDVFSCFPFVRVILKNFHVEIIDIINEVKDFFVDYNSAMHILNVDNLMESLLAINEKVLNRI